MIYKIFNLFKRKNKYDDKPQSDVMPDYSPLIVDMHSHVLPGIDDGAPSPDDSILLIRQMIELGIKKIIATPHIMSDLYRNNITTITNALDILKTELDKEKIEIIVEAAAEYYLDETFEDLITERKLLTMGDNFILFEIPFISRPKNLIEVIVKMTESNYKPILAHPERYSYLKLQDYKIIKDFGCSLQLNTISFTGYYGKEVKKKRKTWQTIN